jgi:cellulose synthase/poly-beta-1,6-N-acetylglucosamine synthase-like glycosyltransferase
LKQISTDVPAVTIGICTLNCHDTIAETLNSILTLIYPTDKMQVVLVDGKSKDDTLKIAAEILGHSKLNWQIATDDGHGLGYARQLIVELSKGVYVAFVDSDQQLHPDFLHNALEHLKTGSKVVAVRGVQGLTYNLPMSGALENYAMYIAEHEAQLEASVINFALGGSMFKKDAIIEAGGFREMFRFAAEDTDLAARLNRLGYKIHNLHSAVFYHYSRPTWKALFRQYRTWGCYRKTIEKTYGEETRSNGILNLALAISCTLGSARTTFEAYRATKDKRCVLLPLNSAFKRSAWTIGYLF